jgi:hypothetical protein
VKEEQIPIEDLCEEYVAFKQLINQLFTIGGEATSIIRAFDKMINSRI